MATENTDTRIRRFREIVTLKKWLSDRESFILGIGAALGLVIGGLADAQWVAPVGLGVLLLVLSLFGLYLIRGGDSDGD